MLLLLQGQLQSAVSAMQQLQQQLDAQVDNVRTDAMQAIALATRQMRAAVGAAAAQQLRGERGWGCMQPHSQQAVERSNP